MLPPGMCTPVLVPQCPVGDFSPSIREASRAFVARIQLSPASSCRACGSGSTWPSGCWVLKLLPVAVTGCTGVAGPARCVGYSLWCPSSSALSHYRKPCRVLPGLPGPLSQNSRDMLFLPCGHALPRPQITLHLSEERSCSSAVLLGLCA